MFQSTNVQGFCTFVGFLFPYGMAAIPFALFFYPKRTGWLEEKGLYGTDFDKTYQAIFFYLLIVLIFLIFCFMCYLKVSEDKEDEELVSESNTQNDDEEGSHNEKEQQNEPRGSKFSSDSK